MSSTKHLRNKNLQKKFSAIDSCVEANNKLYIYKKKPSNPNNALTKKWGAMENDIRDCEINLMKQCLVTLRLTGFGLNETEIDEREKQIKEIENDITKMQIDKLLGVKGPAALLADTTSISTNNKYGFSLEYCRANKIGKVLVRKVKDMCIDNHLSKNQIKKLFPKKDISEEFIRIIINASPECRADISLILLKYTKNQFIIDVNYALYFACQEGMFPLVKYLMKQGGDMNFSLGTEDKLLDAACCLCHPCQKIIDYLIKAGANINQLNKQTYTCLAYQSLKFIKFMIQHGLNINAHDDELIFTACKNGDFKKVKALLSIGARLESRAQEALNDIIMDGCSIFHRIHESQLIKFLIHKGADLNKINKSAVKSALARNHKLSPLITSHFTDIKEWLDVIIKNACDYNQLNILKFLSKKGIDIHLIEKQLSWNYSFTRALGANNFRIAEYLISQAPFVYYGGDIILMARNNKDCLKEDLFTISIQNDSAPILIKINNQFVIYSPLGKEELTFLPEEDGKVLEVLPFDKRVNYTLVKTNHPSLTRAALEIVKKNHHWNYSVGSGSLPDFCWYNSFPWHMSNKNRRKAIQFLLKHGWNDKKTLDDALKQACRSDYLSGVKLLIKKGADYHLKDMANESYPGSTLAECMVYSRFSVNVAKYLLKIGVDINEGNGQALYVACHTGNIQAVKFLISQGANIHVRDDLLLKTAYEEKDRELIDALTGDGKEP